MTPQERQCVNELLEAACINGASLEAAGRSIGQLMLDLTAAEVAEACCVHAEELGLDATHLAQAQASKAHHGDNQRSGTAGPRQRAGTVASMHY